MNKRPAVSVIVPCYNLGEYVTETINSVLAQSYQDFEIIVVNDGSTDDATNRILEDLVRPRTVVLTTANRGLPAARNFAIQQSRGRYVCALDADDLLHPRFLEATIGLLERDPSLAFVSTWVQCFGTEDWIWRQHRCDFPTLLTECVVLTASPVRRSALDRVGGYDEQSYLFGCEDWDLWISLVERGLTGTIVPEVLFRYRQRAGSMRRVSERPEVRMRIWQTLLRKHRASYERFVPDVLLRQELACGPILKENWDLQFEIDTVLKPALEARLARRDLLTRSIAVQACGEASDAQTEATQDQLHAYENELDSLRAEVAKLRASASWKVTTPLRYAYDRYLTARRALTSVAGRNRKWS